MTLTIKEADIVYRFSKIIKEHKATGQSSIENYKRNMRRKLILEEVFKDLEVYTDELSTDERAKVSVFIVRNLFKRSLLTPQMEMRYDILTFFALLEKMETVNCGGKMESFNFMYATDRRAGELKASQTEEIREFLNPKKISSKEKTWSAVETGTIYRDLILNGGRSVYRHTDFCALFKRAPNAVKEVVNEEKKRIDSVRGKLFDTRRRFWQNYIETACYKEGSSVALTGCVTIPWFIWAKEVRKKNSKEDELYFRQQPQEIQDIYEKRANVLKTAVPHKPTTLVFPLSMLHKVKKYMIMKDRKESEPSDGMSNVNRLFQQVEQDRESSSAAVDKESNKNSTEAGPSKVSLTRQQWEEEDDDFDYVKNDRCSKRFKMAE